jgi:Cu+-exporting ATPase
LEPAHPGKGGAHDRAAGSSAAAVKRRLQVAVPLAALVMIIAMWPGWHGTPWVAWATVALAAPVVWWSGWSIHLSNIRGLRHRSVGMDTLVSLGAFTRP